MSIQMGLDIGGTKIAGAVFDNGKELTQLILPTPPDYSALVITCKNIVEQLEEKCGSQAAAIGAGIPGRFDHKTGVITVASNTQCLVGKTLQKDLGQALGRAVIIENDADCAALSEALDGAAVGYNTVLGLIMGTGVGGGFIVDGSIIQSANGLIGEVGHLLLPFREPSDGPITPCVCEQHGCIDKSISGPALARLYKTLTGKDVGASQVGEQARSGDVEALRVLNQFYTTVAKAITVLIYTFDPEVIVVSGGLSNLPGMYETVPQRWGHYVKFVKTIRTKFVPAKFGAMSGLRGAALLTRNYSPDTHAA